MVAGVNVSRDLLWILTQNNNNHVVKRKGFRRRFTTDPLNPKGIANLRFSGAIQRKALTVEPHASGKGVNLVFRKRAQQSKPAKSIARVPLTKGSVRALSAIRSFCNKNFYRKDLKNVALRRASAILRSQKPKSVKRKAAGKSTKKAE